MEGRSLKNHEPAVDREGGLGSERPPLAKRRRAGVGADPDSALDVHVEDTGPCSKVLKIKIPAARVDHEIEETYKNVQKSVQFPGFRQGKAPRKALDSL